MTTTGATGGVAAVPDDTAETPTGSATGTRTLLLVEDDLADQRLFAHQLRSGGLDHRVVSMGTVRDAVAHVTSGADVDLVLLDLGLPDAQGLDTLDRFRAAAPDVPVIVLTGLGDEDVALRSLRRGAHDYLVKGDTGAGELARAIRYALERHELQRRSAVGLLHKTALQQLTVAAAAVGDIQGFAQAAASAVRMGLDARLVAVRLTGATLPNAAAATAVDEDHGPVALQEAHPDQVTELGLTGEQGELGTLTVLAHPGIDLDEDQRQFLSSAASSIVARVQRLAAEAALTTRTRQLDVVQRAAQLLQHSVDAGEALRAVAELLADGIGDGAEVAVEVDVDGHRVTAGTQTQGGGPQGPRVEEPVTVREEDIGTIRLWHPDSSPLGPSGRAVLHGVAAQLGTWWALARADREHRRDIDRIVQLMETAPVGLALVADDGVVRFANAAAMELLAVDSVHDFPWHFGESHTDDLDPALAAVAHVRRTGNTVRDVRVPIAQPDGSERVLGVNASALSPGPGGRGMAIAISDVTAERRRAVLLETALDREQEAVEALRRASDLKDGFLRAVSHELRTPLASVVGFTETLRDHVDDLDSAQAASMLERLHNNAQRLSLLLEDLLDVGRITAGMSSRPARDVHDLAEVVRTVVPLVAVDAHDVRLDLRATPAEIDRPKVERILHNLLRNAVRHTPPGTTVQVTTRRRHGVADLVVEDAGPGIATADRTRIFEPFVQGTEASESASPGTGVGLSLVRQFAEAHGGAVTVDGSDLGGARFTVTFPDP